MMYYVVIAEISNHHKIWNGFLGSDDLKENTICGENEFQIITYKIFIDK